MKTKSLHAKNKFNMSYNFKELVLQNPALEPFVFLNEYGNTTIPFSNLKAVKELNKALLFSYDKISFWDFPDENLCPPIPGRLDYIHHIADLIKSKKDTTILDIGTGANCIYPLLGVAEYDWNFIGTDIDTKAIANAKQIVTKNKLQDSISFRLQTNASNILDGIIKNTDSIDVVMCNPPFYASEKEANQSNKRKTDNLKIEEKRNFSGNSNELIYKGGEKAFLHNYLYQSAAFAKQCNWFTSLVSKKENVKSLQESAKKLKAKSFKVIPMQQGNKLTRIVCWQF
jgi:23S rRNA (adenine1618-N6)-methyltransferase